MRGSNFSVFRHASGVSTRWSRFAETILLLRRWPADLLFNGAHCAASCESAAPQCGICPT